MNYYQLNKLKRNYRFLLILYLVLALVLTTKLLIDYKRPTKLNEIYMEVYQYGYRDGSYNTFESMTSDTNRTAKEILNLQKFYYKRDSIAFRKEFNIK